jgi:outer membrane murein-binding lipoprotein Lpp
MERTAHMTWWSAILATVVPSLIAGGIALLTWRSLRHQQTATAAHEQAQANSLDTTTLADLRRQVDELWEQRNKFREDLAAALQELAHAREDLAEATQDIARLSNELDRARERITLLEQEVARLGGNPHKIGNNL